MAQSDLIIKLIRSAADSDQVAFRKVAEDLISEETRKGHRILAERMRKALIPSYNGNKDSKSNGNALKPQGELFYEITPERELGSLFLPPGVEEQMREVVEEQHRSDLLHSHNLRARHRILLARDLQGTGKRPSPKLLLMS